MTKFLTYKKADHNNIVMGMREKMAFKACLAFKK
jgi:hypothetical protein